MSTVHKFRPHYTVSDYLQWEGDWELWFGTAVSMSPSPFGPHERAVAKFVAQIDLSISTNQCACSVYAGLDWIVYEDTVVRPDVMLVCGEQPMRHLERPPTLTIEVLSKTTANKDLTAKRELYESQRVEHYLIVDTDDHSIRWFSLLSTGKYEDVTGLIPEDGIFLVSTNDGCSIRFDSKAIFA